MLKYKLLMHCGGKVWFFSYTISPVNVGMMYLHTCIVTSFLMAFMFVVD